MARGRRRGEGGHLLERTKTKRGGERNVRNEQITESKTYESLKQKDDEETRGRKKEERRIARYN